MNPFVQALLDLVRSGHTLLHLDTREEARAIQHAQELARALGATCTVWTALEPRAPVDVLDAVRGGDLPSVTVLLDFHEPLRDVRITRRLALLAAPGATPRVLFLAGAGLSIPEALVNDVHSVRMPLPGREELTALLHSLAPAVTPDFTRRAVNAATGLTLEQARRAFSLAVVRHAGLGTDAIRGILREKATALATGVGLETVDVSSGMDAMGGLAGYKAWLQQRAQAFEPGAAAYGLTPPRGVLLLGVQGCGKSMSARCAAATLEIPLLRLDLPRVLGTSGSSAEENLARAITATEAVAPVALWIDEIEKGFAGTAPGQGGDTRASRLLGAMSTWLQERTSQVFVIATANDVSRIPPELLRRGRFDELFFVDLPTAPEREDILRLHLHRRKQDIPGADLSALARDCAGYSGAELEQVVVAGLHRAMEQRRTLTSADLKRVALDMVPLSRTYEDPIKALREWARHRTRPAGRENEVVDLFRRAASVA
jgi:hypothetical protein